MKDVFKELAPRFRVLKKNILDYQREIEKAKKVAEREARRAATAAARVARGRGRGCSRITGHRVKQEGEVREGGVGEEQVQQQVALVLMRTIPIPNHRGLSHQGVAPTPAR